MLDSLLFEQTMLLIIIKEVDLLSMGVKIKEENFSLCRNCSDVSLAMGLLTSSGFIKIG